MAKNDKVTRKQRQVIEDIFRGQSDEQAVLEKHGVSARLFGSWCADRQFRDVFESYIESSYRQSRCIIARYAPLAAAKLVQLTESDKEETARKACLDIIAMQPSGPVGTDEPTEPPRLDSATAGTLLEALARAQKGDKSDIKNN